MLIDFRLQSTEYWILFYYGALLNKSEVPIQRFFVKRPLNSDWNLKNQNKSTYPNLAIQEGGAEFKCL